MEAQAETKIGKLAEALAKSQSEFSPVAKTKQAKIKTKTGGEYAYRYADFADVLKMCLPILAKNGLALLQPLRRSDGKLYVTTRLIHSSGETVESDGIAIPEQLSPQEFGSCLSYWRRYDATALLGIQPDEDDDGRLATTAVGKRPTVAKPPAENMDSEPVVISEGQRRRLFALAKEHGVAHDVLKDHLFKAFGFVTSKDVTTQAYDAVCEWISSVKVTF